MIVSIASSISTFKPVRFNAGLNVLVADTQPGSTAKQTRNSAGKTSLIEIVHFLLGSNCDKDSLFRTNALIGHTFTGTFVVGGTRLTVTRGGGDPSKIFIDDGSENAAGLITKTDKVSNRPYISNVNWRIYLGHAMFQIPMVAGESAFDEPGSPSFRSLFSYFARRGPGSFLKPEQHAPQQQRGDWQANVSYLLGLDWQIPTEFQKIRNREKNLEELKKAAQGQVLGQLIGTVAELRPQVAIAESKAQKLGEQLSNFEVLESYRDLSQRAARAKVEMQSLGREAVSLQETLQYLQKALSVEMPPERADLQKMYEASGIELPEVALRRFEDVNRFYSSVVENRRTHLQSQIGDVQSQLNAGDKRMASLDVERRDILTTLAWWRRLQICDFLGRQDSKYR